MKQVLIIDAPPLFRGFLKEKLSAEKVKVEIGEGRRDAFTKMVSILPDLIILDIKDSIQEAIEFLTKKREDPNACKIPVVVSGPVIAREQVAALVQYNVVKYFNKPIKFDVFFESVGKILGIGFSLDTTPCILEIHINNNIIFVEIAQGLNREKLAMLKYRLTEIIDQIHLTTPKIILMMTDLTLSFVDGANLELLLDNILADSRIQTKNVKILSMDSFTKELVAGHIQYAGIQVASNLSTVINSLVDNTNTTNMADLITDKILSSTDDISQGTVQLQFHSETSSSENTADSTEIAPTIAIVDEDEATRNMLTQTFESINAEVSVYPSAPDFLTASYKLEFDLIILDINLTGINGIDVLKILQNKQYLSPVIIYSRETNKETVMQALNLGAKSYLVKPLKPEVILNKAISVLRAQT